MIQTEKIVFLTFRFGLFLALLLPVNLLLAQQVSMCDSLVSIAKDLESAAYEPVPAAKAQRLYTYLNNPKIKQCKDSLVKNAHYDLANYYLLLGEASKSIELALPLTKKDSSKTGRYFNLSGHNLLGNVYGTMEKPFKALFHYREAKQIAKAVNSKHYTSICVNEASILTNMGDYEQALSVLVDAQKVFTNQQNNHGRAIVYNNIGELYRSFFNQPKKSIAFYKMAIDINTELEDKFNLGKNMHNIALAYNALGKLDSTEIYLNSGINLYKEIGAYASLVKAYYNYANANFDKQEFEKAKEYYQKAELLSEEIGFGIGVFYANMGLLKLALETKQLEEAKKHLAKAEKFKPESAGLEEESVYFQGKLAYLNQAGFYKEALELSKSYYTQKDSLENARNEASILELRASYENDLVDEENARLKAEQEGAANLLKYEQEEKRLYLALTILSGIVLILALFFVFQKQRSFNKQKGLAKQLQEKNEELILAEKRLTAESEMKTKILSVMGHDLRAPFASIAGLLNIINQNILTLEEAKEVTGKLSMEVENTLISLSNILAWSRLQLNETGIIKSTFNLNPLFIEIRELILPVAAAKDIDLVFEVEDKAAIYADANQIRSILNNLLNNAIKFTPKKGLVTLTHQEDDSHHVFSVTDTGVGISEEALYALNNQISHTSVGTSGERGTGIGLSLVKDFTHLHRGTFTFYKNEPKGTVAEVKIPKEKV